MGSEEQIAAMPRALDAKMDKGFPEANAGAAL